MFTASSRFGISRNRNVADHFSLGHSTASTQNCNHHFGWAFAFACIIGPRRAFADEDVLSPVMTVFALPFGLGLTLADPLLSALPSSFFGAAESAPNVDAAEDVITAEAAKADFLSSGRLVFAAGSDLSGLSGLDRWASDSSADASSGLGAVLAPP